MDNKSIPQFQSSLGFIGIIKESFKTAIRNQKILVPTLLLVFLTSSQLDFAQKYVLTSVSKDFLMQLSGKHSNMVQDFSYSTIDYHISDGALDDLREILLVKLLLMAVTYIITLVFLIVTVSSTYEAYTAKLLGQKDIILKIKKSWKRPIVTSFYMTLLSLGLAFFYTISIGVSSILAVNSLALMLLVAITLSIPVCYYYVATLWTVSMIVSVLEDGVGGLKAIGRAAELIKGKRLQASLMMVLFSIANGSVLLMTNFLRSYSQSISASLLITIPFTSGLYCLLKLFMFVVYTVFYHECKTSHDEKEGKGVYIPIAAGEV